jgi:ferric enterobactin receptor
VLVSFVLFLNLPQHTFAPDSIVHFLQTTFMKKLFLSAVLVFSFSFLFAQMPGMGAGKGMPNMGRIYGKLIDSTGKGISDATVLLLQNKYDSTLKKNKEVLLKGMTTQSNGD